MTKIRYNESNYSSDQPFKFLHISHTDLDGYSCTILSKLVEENAPYAKGTYVNTSPNRLCGELDTWKDQINDFDQIWITDMAITQEIVDKVNELGCGDRLMVLDHHATTLTEIPEWLCVAKYADDDINGSHYVDKSDGTEPDEKDHYLTCATMLFYNYLMKSIFSSYLIDADYSCGKPFYLQNSFAYAKAVESYDTFSFWPHQINGNLEEYASENDAQHMIDGPRLNALYHCINRDMYYTYIRDFLIGVIDPNEMTRNSPSYNWIGMLIDLELERNQQYNESALKRLTIVHFKKDVYRNQRVIKMDYTAGIVFAEKNGPTIGNTACCKMPSIDFCAVVCNNQVSLYSIKDDIKVCDIAAAFGGGGHDSAAGFTISYQNANIFNVNHFFDIVGCAGRIAE